MKVIIPRACLPWTPEGRLLGSQGFWWVGLVGPLEAAPPHKKHNVLFINVLKTYHLLSIGLETIVFNGGARFYGCSELIIHQYLLYFTVLTVFCCILLYFAGF